MLTDAENNLICRTGPGTPMGEVLRRYWLPCLLISDLPENDGAPVRVKILGEELVAFRELLASCESREALCSKVRPDFSRWIWRYRPNAKQFALKYFTDGNG